MAHSLTSFHLFSKHLNETFPDLPATNSHSLTAARSVLTVLSETLTFLYRLCLPVRQASLTALSHTPQTPSGAQSPPRLPAAESSTLLSAGPSTGR